VVAAKSKDVAHWDIPREDVEWLTPHHIIPLSDGGSDKKKNIIVLCLRCHNAVELALYDTDLSTYRKVGDFCCDSPVDPRPLPPPDSDWRSWVYGGCRNPNLDRWSKNLTAVEAAG